MLKPCPFCGCETPEVSEDDLGFSRWVYCPGCEADGPPIDYRFSGTKDEAKQIVVRQWNERTPNKETDA